MRRFLLLSLLVILGSIGLMAGYVMWDYDPDDVSPMVPGPSYGFLFDEAVRQRMGRSYDELDADGRRRALADLIASREIAPVREVALFRTRQLADRDAALAMLAGHLDALDDNHFEVAIGSIAALGTPKSSALLDSLYRKLDADPAAHTPLGDYRTSTIVVSRTPDLSLAFNERSRNDADYSADMAREISFFLPADPEYVISIPNADDVLKSYHDSRFAHTLEKSPVPEDAWKLPMLRTLASLRKRLDETMGMLAPYFSPERLFRDQLVIGKYDDEYLVASFKDKNVTVAETLMDIFSGLGRDFGIARRDVEGNAVSTVRNLKSGRTLSYAVVGDYFLAATDTTLIDRAVRTYASDRASSIAIDPVFNRSFSALDQSGEKDVFFAWFDPTDYFGIIGSSNPAARRLAIVRRSLGRNDVRDDAHARASLAAANFPGATASTIMSGDDPSMLWRYIIDVRSLGRNPIDSLARLARVDIGRQVVPYLSRSMALGYGGVQHLRQNYGYSNTAFDLLLAMPLRNAPSGFDSTMKTLFGGITSLVYTQEPGTPAGTRLWIASDTATHDTLLMARKLQPSFAVVGGRMLVIASTPALLRTAAPAIAAADPPGDVVSTTTYLSGSVKVDSLTANAMNYLHSYLLRTDLYTPGQIDDRMEPLRKGLELYDNLVWAFRVENGLRVGEGTLVMKN